MEPCILCGTGWRTSSLDPFGELPRGSLCISCRRDRFADWSASCEGSGSTALGTSGSGKCTAAAAEEIETSIEISASTLGGDSCTFAVGTHSSVADIKKMIQYHLGITWYSQQLVCEAEVLMPETALIKDFPVLAEAASVPHLMVIKLHPWIRCKRVTLDGSKCAAVNGTYTRLNTNCYAKVGDASIRIFRYEADESWPAAWYIERKGMEDRSLFHRGVYYAVPDQSLTDSDPTHQELGFPLPIGGWEPWTGTDSEPGEHPGPTLTALD